MLTNPNLWVNLNYDDRYSFWSIKALHPHHLNYVSKSGYG